MSDDALPAIKRFQTGDQIHVSTQQVWLILVTHVEAAKRTPGSPRHTNYGGEGSVTHLMGRGLKAGRTIDRQLGIIGTLCVANGLPAINAIVVNKDRKVPGRGLVQTPDKTNKQEIDDVYKVDWFSVRVPTTGTFRKVREES